MLTLEIRIKFSLKIRNLAATGNQNDVVTKNQNLGATRKQKHVVDKKLDSMQCWNP
jgi:hypothetical protein